MQGVSRSTTSDFQRSAPLLDVVEVTKSYGTTKAIEEVSFVVEPGRVVGLVGANGAGKTTTIACIVGLLRPDGGAIRWCGTDVTAGRPRHHRWIGLCGQEIALYPSLTGRANLRFFGELAGMRRSEVDESIVDLAGELGFGTLLDRPVLSLSGGQRRLLHVAGALVHRPRLALLDEPSNGLDVRARHRLLGALRRLAEAGTGILFSSHYLGEVEEACDDAVILHKGHVVAAGPMADLINRYGEPFVEVRMGGLVTRMAGSKLGQLMATVPDLDELDSVSVVRPSLEAVFMSLIDRNYGTEGGSEIEEDGRRPEE